MPFLKRAAQACLGLALVASAGQAQVNPNTGGLANVRSTSPNTGGAFIPSSSTAGLVVTYENGALSISADGATLMDVLNQVQKKTGASVEFAGVSDTTRITVTLGPDEPRKVLSALLYGTPFNYVIVDTSDAGVLAKVILMPRASPGIALAEVPIVASPTPEPPKTDVATADGSAGETVIADNKDPKKDEETPADSDNKKDDKNAKDADKNEVAQDKKGNEAGDLKSTVASSKIGGDDGSKDGAVAEGEPSASDRLADLPSTINPAIAGLYPSLSSPGLGTGVQGSSSVTNAVPAGTPVVSVQPVTPSHNSYGPAGGVPVDATGIPILPSNIPQQMWGLYPPNLLQLISNNAAPPSIPITPLSPGLPTTGTGQVIFWDQTLKPSHP